MRKTLGTFVGLLFMLALPVRAAEVKDDPVPATATRPSPTGPEQTSVPNNAPPASRTETTGQPSHDPVIKQMNESEKNKVEREGK